ncbi:unnamed protein product [Strongylus vulgaris]|uniref:Uncharacterized protein n=1 Tax=Strongylus vulgaris TaxID=40348 RepID=A0A3P7IZ56_STRVU|nr:unnamed protein product [Strongylus vulgaris]
MGASGNCLEKEELLTDFPEGMLGSGYDELKPGAVPNMEESRYELTSYVN